MFSRFPRKPKPRRAIRDDGRTAKRLARTGLGALAVTAVTVSGLGAATSYAHAPEYTVAQVSPSQNSGLIVQGLREAESLTRAAEDPHQIETVLEFQPAPTGALPVASGQYRLGAGWGATGSWSRYHTGVDLSAPTGTPMYAVASGVVRESMADGWAGVHVVIEHEEGSTLYAHMNSKIVRPGDVVTAGQLIGEVGNTGRSFGSHLHIEFYPKGASLNDPYSAVDPTDWLDSKGVRF